LRKEYGLPIQDDGDSSGSPDDNDETPIDDEDIIEPIKEEISDKFGELNDIA
jgi:hypothetical protein